MHFDAEFYVAIGFVVFVLALGWLGVHRQIGTALDGRIKKIEDELAEARRLKVEAEALLASFKKKASDAEAEAAAIVTQAQAEAEALAKDAAARLSDFVERRKKQAQDKIGLAETQAIADVRAAAADVAVKTAEIVIRAQTAGSAGAELVAHGIEDVKRLMN